MIFSEFVSKYQKVPVFEFPNSVLKETLKPLVSCRISTYQHAQYIRQCIEGVLAQRTSFPFEIVIGEDESTDGTREICIEFARKYPNIIRLFLHKRENNILINGKESAKFQGIYTFFKLRGKYQAICEGDDYWTDPYKLQKQVDFLEKNDDYNFSYTNYLKLVNTDKKQVYLEMMPSGLIFNSLLKNNFIGTVTVLCRRDLICQFLASDYFTMNISIGDYPMWLYLSMVGKAHYLSDVTAMYRIHNNSVSNFLNPNKKYFFQLEVMEIRKRFVEINKLDINILKEGEVEMYARMFEAGIYNKNVKLLINATTWLLFHKPALLASLILIHLKLKVKLTTSNFLTDIKGLEV